MLRVAAQRLAHRATSFAGVAAQPALVPFARHYADDANLLKTALYDFHLEMGGKMVSECVCVCASSDFFRLLGDPSFFLASPFRSTSWVLACPPPVRSGAGAEP